MIHSIMHFILIRVKRGQDSAPVSVCNIGPHKNTCFGRGKIEKRELQRAEQKGSEKTKWKKALSCGAEWSYQRVETLKHFEEKSLKRKVIQSSNSGWVATQTFFMFIPNPGKMDPIWLIFFQMGWNHQLELHWYFTTQTDRSDMKQN